MSEINNEDFTPIQKRLLYQIEMTKHKEILTLRDVELLSNLSESSCRRAVREGRLEKMQHRKGSKLMFEKSAVLKWLKGGN